MPARNPAGMKTADSTSAIPTSAPPTSSIASSAASRGDRPCSILASIASTTTIASSTTRPTASTSPSSESVLTENPTAGKEHERAHQRDRNSEQWDQRRAPTLQEDEHHQRHQRDRLEQRVHDLAGALGHRNRGVERQARASCLAESGCASSAIFAFARLAACERVGSGDSGRARRSEEGRPLVYACWL